ncbi:MAG TPA: alpha/beta hydrolase [Candidatus Limnocylindrales bacterium]
MPTIDANGRATAYEVDGAGPPLVLLHGATGSGGDHFRELVPVLSTGFRCYLPDARGHGGTAWDPSESWTTADLVADLDAFVDELGLETFHLFGYSLGGMTALHYASRFPDRIRTLVAASIGTEREPRLAVGRALMDPDRIERDDPEWAARLAARHDPAHGSGAWRRLLDAIVADIADQPLLTPREIREIDAPTLVVAGDRDPFVPITQAAALARQVGDGRLLILPDVGHDSLVDHLPLLEAALTEFYRSTESIARTRAREAPTTEVPT